MSSEKMPRDVLPAEKKSLDNAQHIDLFSESFAPKEALHTTSFHEQAKNIPSEDTPDFGDLMSAVSTGLNRPLEDYDDPEQALSDRIDALVEKPSAELSQEERMLVHARYSPEDSALPEFGSMDNMFKTLPKTAEELDSVAYDEPLPEDYDTKDSDDPFAIQMRHHPAIKGKYHIIRELGRGAQGTTWLARFQTSNRYVAIKALGFDELSNWKSTELFMREIETLKSMKIEGTPQYIEAIDASTDPAPYYFLVQTLIPGKTLEDMLKEGYVFSSEDTSAIALAILPILSQMRSFVPPIVHRDIKPSNLMLTPSGRVYLIDFGASMLHERSLGGTTVAGTAGYMSPEQCLGSSSPESDIYSLGATLVHLLTGKPPWQLTLTSDMHLLFKSYLPLNTSPQLSQLLEAMLDPMPDKRLSDLPRLLRFLRADGGAEKSKLFANAPRSIANQDFDDTKSSKPQEKPKPKAAFTNIPFLPDALFEKSNRIHITWFFMLLFVVPLMSAFSEYSFSTRITTCVLAIIANVALFMGYAILHKNYNIKLYKKLERKNALKNREEGNAHD